MGVNSDSASGKCVTHRINTVRHVQSIFVGREARPTGEGIVGRGRRLSRTARVRIKGQRGWRRWAGVVAPAYRLVGGCVGLLPVSGDLY